MIPKEEEILPEDTSLEKYYTPKMIQVGTFLGGPIAAGYFIGKNYKAFGQYSKNQADMVSIHFI